MPRTKPKDQITAAEAKQIAIRQDQDRALKAIAEARGREARAKESHTRARLALDRLVATAVSAKPAAIDWYEHPGPLNRDEVKQQAGLSTMQLHRLMERYRKTATAKKSRRRR